MSLPADIEGTCDPAFSSIPEILAEQLASGAHHGVAVAVHHRGELVVDVWGGRRGRGADEKPWTEDTMAVSFSTTKWPAATALHMAMERSGLSYDTPIAQVWPEFGTKGKEKITVRHALCHEAGVPQIRGECKDVWALADWEGMVRMMEGLEPLWEPGTANGYHAINFGWLVGETLRRIDGRHLCQFLAEEITGPLKLDGFYIGTPEEEHGRLAPVATDPLPEGAPTLDSFLGPDSLLARALSPEGNMEEFLNSPGGDVDVRTGVQRCVHGPFAVAPVRRPRARG
jgi:CubicO group peptidase (beta-lactamase class C family)